MRGDFEAAFPADLDPRQEVVKSRLIGGEILRQVRVTRHQEDGNAQPRLHAHGERTFEVGMSKDELHARLPGTWRELDLVDVGDVDGDRMSRVAA
jgi:hypothetical protein